jgi:hypothetical protein
MPTRGTGLGFTWRARENQQEISVNQQFSELCSNRGNLIHTILILARLMLAVLMSMKLSTFRCTQFTEYSYSVYYYHMLIAGIAKSGNCLATGWKTESSEF